MSWYFHDFCWPVPPETQMSNPSFFASPANPPERNTCCCPSVIHSSGRGKEISWHTNWGFNKGVTKIMITVIVLCKYSPSCCYNCSMQFWNQRERERFSKEHISLRPSVSFGWSHEKLQSFSPWLLFASVFRVLPACPHGSIAKAQNPKWRLFSCWRLKNDLYKTWKKAVFLFQTVQRSRLRGYFGLVNWSAITFCLRKFRARSKISRNRGLLQQCWQRTFPWQTWVAMAHLWLHLAESTTFTKIYLTYKIITIPMIAIQQHTPATFKKIWCGFP